MIRAHLMAILEYVYRLQLSNCSANVKSFDVSNVAQLDITLGQGDYLWKLLRKTWRSREMGIKQGNVWIFIRKLREIFHILVTPEVL